MDQGGVPLDQCPICQKPYGKRKRCYSCTSKKKSGEQRTCVKCGASFYAAAWQLNDTKRRQGTYCSNRCKWDHSKELTPAWAKPNEKTRHSAGYVLIWKPDHPRASRGRVFEHIVVMEEQIGRSLLPGEFVHHKDGNKTNNDPSNLVILSNEEHATLHAKDNPNCQQRRITVQCKECGKDFDLPSYRVSSTDPKTKQVYCSLSCRHASWGRQMKEKRRQKREAKTTEQ